MRCALWGGSSTDAGPVPGSLVSSSPLDCLNNSCAVECVDVNIGHMAQSNLEQSNINFNHNIYIH